MVGLDDTNGSLWCSPRAKDVEADLIRLPCDRDERRDALVLGRRCCRWSGPV
ncbi:MAG: hypothetical protein WDM88_12115 [Galbitalea sp.]